MTANMVERVARAICLADGEDPDERCEDWMQEFSGWRGYVESARAAIAAMREPTEAMLEAGRSTPPRTRCLEVYRAMIDEALK